MLEKVLKNIAYLYYPKGICSITEDEKYTQTEEFKSLSDNLDKLSIDNDFQKSRALLLNRFNEHEIINKITDVTLEFQDRCLSFEIEIVENKILTKICLKISLLIPYYFIYALKNEIETEPNYKWLNLPVRDGESEIRFNEEIKLLAEITEKIINFNPFPEHLVEKIIDEINYNDIELGSFTYFNAFFLDNINS